MSEDEDVDARIEFFIFLGTDQLNRAIDYLLHEEGEHMRIQLAELNLRAANLSISKSCFYRAVDFLETGISLLDKKSMWDPQTYHLCLELHNNLCEMEYTLGRHEKATETAAQILRNTHIPENYRAQFVLSEVAISRKDRNLEKGIDMCLAILKSYNVDLPRKPNKFRIMIEFRRLKKNLPNGKLEDLVHLPVMTEDRAYNLSVFLSKVANYSSLSGVEYFPLMKLAALKTFNLCCMYGINSHCALAAAQYAIAQRLEGNFSKAFSIAMIAAELLNKISPCPGDVRAKVGMIINSAYVFGFQWLPSCCFVLFSP
jgi:predicted ATPase